MQDDIIKKFFNQDISFMKSTLESDNRYNSIDPNLISNLFNIIKYQIDMSENNLSVKIKTIYHKVKKNSSKQGIEFDDYTFFLSLVKYLYKKTELYKLSYFEDTGWIVLKIKGKCFHGTRGYCI